MTVTSGELSQLQQRLVGAAERFSALVRDADPTRRVPGTPKWDLGQLVAHVAIEARRYETELTAVGEWSPSPSLIAETNDRALADVPTHDVAGHAREIVRAVTAYTEAVARRDLDVPSHHLDGGILMAPKHAAGLLLGELVVHGYDAAGALDRKWTIDGSDAARVIAGIWSSLSGWVRPEAVAGHKAFYELRLRGHGHYFLRLAAGEARVDVTSASGRPDVVMSADPTALLLVLYGRMSRTHALLTGKAVSWGRKPFLALRLRDKFYVP